MGFPSYKVLRRLTLNIGRLTSLTEDSAIYRRGGLTLIEFLVVIGILAVLIGLLVGAVMSVREAAIRTESLNNLKQIVLGIHHFANDHRDRLPSIDGNLHSANKNMALFAAILPYIEQGNGLSKLLANQFIMVQTYLSPADPTAPEALAVEYQVSSYAANALVFKGDPRLPTTIPDGTSQTIAFAEHYAFNCGGNFFFYLLTEPGIGGLRRATFADMLDLVPGPPGQQPQVTFQVAPTRNKCSGGIAQTPHRGGMLVALTDGSVRTLAPGISPETYWGAVTPAGGEVLEDW